jgi:non-specific serine/threonine protein kinase/serine/threonine-protein kinase
MGDLLRTREHRPGGNGQSDLVEAERYYRSALEKSRRVLGEEHPRTFEYLAKLGQVLMDLGRPDEAVICFREALEKSRRVLGEDHPETIDRLYRVGLALCDSPEGRAILIEAVAKKRRARGETHADTLNAVLNVAQILRDRGQPNDGEAMLAESVAAHQREHGTHPQTALLLDRHARHLQQMGRLDEAEAEFRRAVTMYLEHPGVLQSSDQDVTEWSVYESGLTVDNLSRLLVDRGRVDEALAVRREMLAAQRRGLPQECVELCDQLETFGLRLLELRTLACAREAEPLLREALQIRALKLPEDWQVFETRSRLCEALLFEAELEPTLTPAIRAARLREVEPLLVESNAQIEKMPVGPEKWDMHNDAYRRRSTAARLAHLYEVWSVTEPGRGHEAETAEWTAKVASADAVLERK